jgi:Fe-S cluster biogenesis protein NfuA
MVKKIKTILDEYIRPAVEQDGGAITFHSYHDKKVTVMLQGSCSGCPSSTITLKAGIENLFKRMMPGDVDEVVALG